MKDKTNDNFSKEARTLFTYSWRIPLKNKIKTIIIFNRNFSMSEMEKEMFFYHEKKNKKNYKKKTLKMQNNLYELQSLTARKPPRRTERHEAT